MRRLISIALLTVTGGVQAASFDYLSQTRSVSVSTLACPGLGGSASAPDFGEFDATVASPVNVPALGCEDKVKASQTSSLADSSISLHLHVFSGSANLDGGGPALSRFDVSFSLAESTWLQFSGTRFVQTELGPNVVESENATVFESLTSGGIDLSWAASACDTLVNGSLCIESLDTLVQLGPGDYRLAVTSLAHVDGVFLEFGAYRELGTELLVTTAVPVPAAVWLFGSGLAGFGLLGVRRRK